MDPKLSILIMLFVANACVWGYETGPPVSTDAGVCVSMYPSDHGNTIATGAAPYRITTGSPTYSAGQTILVTVESTDGISEIEGVFMQARRKGAGKDGNKAIGLFSNPPANTQLLNCGRPDSAWAHSAELDATAATVTWKAPPCDEGPIAFMATIVKGPKELYWTGVLSGEMTFTGANSTDCNSNPPPPPSGDPMNPKTTPSKGALGADVSPIMIVVGVIGTLCLAGFKWY